MGGTSGKAVRVRVRVRASRFRSIPLRSAPLRADLFYSSHTYLNLFFGENKIDRMADQQEEETRLMDAPVEMELKRIGFVKDAMKTVEPYYEKYMPYILETVDGQVDFAILYGMSLYDAGKSKVSVAQAALEAASDNLRAARESVASSLHTENIQTFYQAREAYKKKLTTYLSALKKEGKKLPSTISEMIFKNVEYLKDCIVSLKDQPTVSPYISGATEYSASSVQPYVETAMTKVQPYVDTAMTNVSPYLPKTAKVA